MKSICLLALVVVMAVAVNCEWRRPQPLTGQKTTLSEREFNQLKELYLAGPKARVDDCNAYVTTLRRLLNNKETNKLKSNQ